MLKKFRSFDEMITPGIIKVIYYISLVFVGILSLVMLMRAMAEGEILLGLLLVVPVAIFGVIMVRVYCELIMLGFKIHDYLKNINEKLNQRDDEFNF